MRQIAARLYREHKMRVPPYLPRPPCKVLPGRQTVEAAVDLHSREAPRVMRQPIFLLQVVRIEAPYPVLVHPARRADKYHAKCTPAAFTGLECIWHASRWSVISSPSP